MTAAFKVVPLESAKQDIRQLFEKAMSLGIAELVKEALRSAIAALADEPLVFGDRIYRTRRPGGVVCHGNRPPLFFRFAVYELERVVILYRVVPLPASVLDV